ncbi:MAG: RNA methyltransferase [Bacteroidia bacterium]|nr:RNA methyltransferase [Bacteroidia bacterium]MDW8135008.1 RNA methyltransferase [Bacteroidia bacterium]
MEKVVITDIRALRRALEGGVFVEKVVSLQGSSPPPSLWFLVKRYRLRFQQVPSTALPKHSTWAAYLSPIRLYSLNDWLADTPQGVALALIGLTDPWNVGAILRSAAAFEAKWILIRAEGMPTFSSETIWRASGGALLRLKIVRVKSVLTALSQLKEKGWHLIATVPPHHVESIPYTEWNWTRPFLLLIGSERKGLPPPYLTLCENRITIPHSPYVESLNVNAATSILLAAAYHQQKNAP